MKLELTVCSVGVRGDKLKRSSRLPRVDELQQATAVGEGRFVGIRGLWEAVGCEEHIEGRADRRSAVFGLREQETVDIGGDDLDDGIEHFLVSRGADERAEFRRQPQLFRNVRVRSGKQYPVG